MTNEHDTQAVSVSKIQAHQRRLTVRKAYHSYQLNQDAFERTPIGEIRLKGHWLIQAGFAVDTAVKVRVMDGCLVLTKHRNTSG